ncbi:uncharacterized protein [Scyliorhinus torazame]|uniref:uncharacterized protein isoform X3 n=1 Tax=Scyliorhinus torazame TaxID=75743 RepID=UPI003B5B6052
MAERHQVKTSFLYVRLQPPTQPAGQTEPATSANAAVIDSGGVPGGCHDNHKQFCGGCRRNNGQRERGSARCPSGSGPCPSIAPGDGCRVLDPRGNVPPCGGVNLLDPRQAAAPPATANNCCPCTASAPSSRRDGVRWKVQVSKPNAVEAPLLCQNPRPGGQRFTSRLVDWSPKLVGTPQESRATHSGTSTPPTSPNALQKTETFVWINRTSPHAQSVAKAKYQFLFGTPAEDNSLDRGCFQSPGEERCMNTISLTEQAFRQGADEAQRRNWDLPPREVVVWEPGQINRPQDFGHEQEKARPESQPGCSGPSTTVGRMVPGFDGGCTVTDTDEDHLSDLSEDISPDPLEKQTSVWEFATVLVSTPQVMTAPVFSIGQGQQAELLHWGKEVAASGENELSRGASDERVQQELAAGDKEMPQSPSVAHKEIGLVVLEERSTEATDRMSERHTGAAAERDPDKLMAKEIANLDQSGETEKERSGHVKSDESSGTSWDGGKRTPLSTAQSDTRSDEDDDVFVSARESEASVTSKSSLGTKSANLLLLTVTDKPEFECTWTSPSEVTDIFSSQFEHIMECQRLKGTSYNSLDSLDVISSTDESECGFSFETPLTPMIQQRIKESSQFMELAIEETASGTRVLQPCMDTNDSLGGGLEESVSSSALDHLSHKPSLYAVVNGAPQLSELFQEGQKEPSTSSERGLKEMLPDGDLEVDSMEQLELHGSTEVVTNGNKSDLEAARRLAKRLYNLEGFKRSDVARHLGKNNDFSKLVAEEYLRYFDFTGLTLDQSLRFFLKAFALMGETQERERVLIHFSERYYQCNMGTIPSQDGVHCLTCAMMLLNTDLHGHVNIGKKMTCQDFINNLDGLNGGKDFPKDLLKALYNSIKNEKLEWAINEEELRKSLSELANDKTDHAGSKANNRIGSGTNPFLDIPQDPNAKTYKTGFLSRKLHADMDGKKSES